MSSKKITLQVKLDPEEKAHLDKISEEYGLENARRLTYFFLKNVSNGTISMSDIISNKRRELIKMLDDRVKNDTFEPFDADAIKKRLFKIIDDEASKNTKKSTVRSK